MAKKWSEVTDSPEYKALPPEDRELARQQYFQEVITPQLPAEEVASARAEFDKSTKQEPKPKRGEWSSERLPPGAPLYVKGSLTEGLKMTGKGIVGTLLETPAAMASGAAAGVAGGVAGAGRAVGSLLSGEGLDTAVEKGVHTMESVQQAGTYQPRTEAGQAIQRGMGAVMGKTNELLGDVGGAVGGAIGGQTGENIGRTLGEHAVDAVAARAGVKGLTGALRAPRAAPTALTQGQNAIVEAQQAGYKVLPSAGKPGAVNATIESLADTERTKVHLIKENVKQTGELARKAIGLTSKDPINEKVISDLRKQNNTAYENLKALPDRIANDEIYTQAIKDLDESFRSVKEHTPSLYTQAGLERVRGALEQSQSQATGGLWTPEAIVDISRSLRSTATKTLKSSSATAESIDAAFAMKQGADALEGLLERHLDAAGNAAALEKFRKARTNLAKLHVIEENTNLVTGEVNPQGLRRAMEKGEHLTDELRTIARAAAAMPEVVRTTEGLAGKEAAHWSDIGLGGAVAGSIAAGHLPAAAAFGAAAAARPLIRRGIASKAYQKHMATPKQETPGPKIPMSAAAAGGAAAMKKPEYKLEDAEQ
jgi:hypothetical protein